MIFVNARCGVESSCLSSVAGSVWWVRGSTVLSLHQTAAISSPTNYRQELPWLVWKWEERWPGLQGTDWRLNITGIRLRVRSVTGTRGLCRADTVGPGPTQPGYRPGAGHYPSEWGEATVTQHDTHTSVMDIRPGQAPLMPTLPPPLGLPLPSHLSFQPPGNSPGILCWPQPQPLVQILEICF